MTIRGLKSLLRVAPFGGRCAFPFPEGTEEGIGVFVPEEASRLAELNRRLPKIMFCQFPAGVADELAEAGAIFRDAPLQGPAAHPQFFGHVRDSGTVAAQQTA